MKSKTIQLAVLSVILFGLMTACTSTKNMHTQTVPDSQYRAALEWTDPSKYDLPIPGSPEELAMIDRVKTFFSQYNQEGIQANFSSVYADELYFRDAFKQFTKGADIEAYFIHGLEPLNDAQFIFNRVVHDQGEYYIDWLMRLDFKKTPEGTWEESIGMTHLRFNSEGKVIFHQDYWDPTDIVYRRIPIAKQLIAFVKGKM